MSRGVYTVMGDGVVFGEGKDNVLRDFFSFCQCDVGGRFW